jgi:hypothetical protein
MVREALAERGFSSGAIKRRDAPIPLRTSSAEPALPTLRPAQKLLALLNMKKHVWEPDGLDVPPPPGDLPRSDLQPEAELIIEPLAPPPPELPPFPSTEVQVDIRERKAPLVTPAGSNRARLPIIDEELPGNS